MPEHEVANAIVPAAHDAFGRARVAEPVTLFDSKQQHDNLPLMYDDQEVSGGSTTSTHSVARASTTIGVAASTAGKRVRQTFRRFNYQPGKSQLAFLTAVMGDHGTGIRAEVGLVDDNNGLYFYSDDGVIGVGVRSSVSGSPVDTELPQSSWNMDKMNGAGAAQGNPSGIKMRPDKAQILVIDYEWLGVGTVRFGVVIDGYIHYVHRQNHANIIESVYMSTPNLPVRYSIENDGTGGAAELEHICSTVIAEGGMEDVGRQLYVSTGGAHLDANSADTLYAAIGIRLKSTHLDSTVLLNSVSMMSESVADFEWVLLMNPTVAGTFTYSDVTNASIQRALGATANTVTGGYALGGGYQVGGNSGSFSVPESPTLLIGSAIDGTPDEMVLCVRPLAANLDIQSSLTLREME